MVNRDVEEALDLVGVEVAGHYPVNSGGAEEIGHELGSDGNSRLVLPVLPCPSEIRHYGNDFVGGSPFCRIDGEEKLHQIVGRRKCGLEDEYGGAAYALGE